MIHLASASPRSGARRIQGPKRAGKDASLSARPAHVREPLDFRAPRAVALSLRAALALLSIFIAATLAPRAADAQVEFTAASRDQPVQFAADEAYRFADGDSDVWVLRGSCYLNQGLVYARSGAAVIWIRRNDNSPHGRHRVTAYLEGGVTVDQGTTPPLASTAGPRDRAATGAAGFNFDAATAPGPRLTSKAWLGHFFTDQEPQARVARLVGAAQEMLDLYARAAAYRDPVAGAVVRRAQFAADVPPAANVPGALPPGMRRLRAFPRSDVRVQAEWFPDPAHNEWVAVITGGVTMIVEGSDKLGPIDISTDRLVIWTRGSDQPDLAGQTLQRDDTPLEFYLEGNVELRQADRVISARAMYYNVHEHNGVVLDAEMLATVKQFEGKLRFQASVLRQLSEDRFSAQSAHFTTSRIGEPSYWLQSNDVTLEDHPTAALDPRTGLPAVDVRSPQGVVDHHWLLTGSDNRLFVESAPIFYWPTLTTDLDEPGFFLKDLRFKTDGVFGTQVLTTWNAYQLLGLDKPIPGTTWDAGFDYFSERGPAVDSKFVFDVPNAFGIDGPARGLMDAYVMNDTGVDNLGLNRRSVTPETDTRGRVLLQDRQQFGDGYQFTAELGLISDNNFLEQYYKNEFEDSKSETTDLELKRFVENSSWSIYAEARLNPFFTETQWLPRADHFLLGQPLLGNWLTWYEHSNVGYAQMMPASAAANSNDPNFKLLPWEAAVNGERLATRQEIDLPLEIGPMKVVPYALGELAHWGADLADNELDRAYGQLGVRATLPMWKVDPTVHSDLFNLNGLAHKVTFEADFAISDANRPVTDLPLYDPIDDDAITQFRHDYVTEEFGGVLPPKFDPRYYAIRAGLDDWVTSPSTEIAGQMETLRLGAHQVWQTKRGLPGEEHIVDWITLDTDMTVFPAKNRDDFGSLIGLMDYDFRWHVGDRVTVLSDGIFDTFSQGERIVNVGVALHRPDLGSMYAGIRSIGGPINSQLLVTTLSYRMSPKWITSLNSSLTIGGQANTTQEISFTRVGESLLVSFGVYADEGQGTVGARLMIEPRFFRASEHNLIDGVHVPPAGSLGLE